MPIIDARYYKALLISPNRNVTAEIMPLLAYGLPLAPIHDVNAYPGRRELVDLLAYRGSEALFSGLLNRAASLHRPERSARGTPRKCLSWLCSPQTTPIWCCSAFGKAPRIS